MPESAKYFEANCNPIHVSNLTIAFASCETTFSVMKSIFLLYFFRMRNEITPWQKPKNGCHQSKTTRSAFSFFLRRADFIQLKGLIELIPLSLGTWKTCSL